MMTSSTRTVRGGMICWAGALACLIALPAAAHAQAQPPTAEERLAQLEEQLDQVLTRLDQLHDSIRANGATLEQVASQLRDMARGAPVEPGVDQPSPPQHGNVIVRNQSAFDWRTFWLNGQYVSLPPGAMRAIQVPIGDVVVRDTLGSEFVFGASNWRRQADGSMLLAINY